MTPEKLAENLLEMLRSERSPALEALLEVVMDSVLEVPAGELVEVDDISDPLVAAFVGKGWLETAARHVIPGWELEQHRVAECGDTLGDVVPQSVRDAIEARTGRPLGMSLDWTRGIVEPAFVQDLTAGVISDLLKDFMENIPLGGKLFGSLARGVGKVGKRGGSSFGPMISDFAKQRSDSVRERVEARLKTPEGERALKEMRKRAIAQAMTIPLRDLYGVLDDPGMPELLALAEDFVAHNMARAETRGAIVSQVWLALSLIKEMPTGAWLAELGIEKMVRARIKKVARKAAATATATVDFEAWLVTMLRAGFEKG